MRVEYSKRAIADLRKIAAYYRDSDDPRVAMAIERRVREVVARVGRSPESAPLVTQRPGTRVVLAVHSGAGASGYGASDRVPEQIAAMVYVDTGPAKGALDPDFDALELPLPSREKLAEEENLDGLSEEQLEEFRRRAVPEPGTSLREGAELTNDARLDVPSTVVCTGFTSAEYQEAVGEGQAWLAGLAELHDVTWVDLPTSHWPMWSRPGDLAGIIGGVAQAHARA
jgi:plasmid stabilization system protein ParE